MNCRTFLFLLLTTLSVSVRGTAFTSNPPLLTTLKKVLPTDRRDAKHPRSASSKQRRKVSLAAAGASPSLTEEEEESTNVDNGSDNKSHDDIPRGGGGASSLPRKLPPLPTLTSYRKFALPCLGLWVMQPLLSLIDTSFVGLSSGSAESAGQLAALGPATTFFDGATYLFAFLNVATTNLYSSARAQAGPKSAKAESVVRTAARVALICGFSVMALLLLYSRPLLALYIGHESASQPNLLDWATEYVKIRALSMPTSLLLGVLQAALLGAKDSVTPLVAVVYSMVVNIFGDYICVNRLGLGLRGAAIATTLAQWAATYALIGPARQELVQDHDLGLTSNKHQRQRRSSNEDVVTGGSFIAFAFPVLTLILGKLAAFGFMTHAAAGLAGQPTTLAAHQIILSTFFFISPFLEVISQTAQTFLPPYLAPVKDYVQAQQKKNHQYDVDSDSQAQKWFGAAFAVETKLLMIGLVVSAFVSTLVSAIPAYFGNIITNDLTVQNSVKPLAKYLWTSGLLTSAVAVSEGCLLAKRELPFLAAVYVVSSIVLPFALVEIKKAQGPVGQVWAAFAFFQLFRAVCFAGRIWGEPALSRVKHFFKRRSKRTTEVAS